jgi:cytochrome P450
MNNLKTAQHTSPPGPRPLTFLQQTLDFRRDPITFLTSMTQTYGNISQSRLLMWPMVFLNHPDYIRHVMVENHQGYDKGNPLFNILSLILGNGLGTAEEALWKRQRRLLQPMFQKLSVATFSQTIIDETVKLCKHLDTIADTGESVDVMQEMGGLALSSVGSTIFKIESSAQVDTIGNALEYLFNFLGEYFRMPFPPLHFPTRRNRQVKQTLCRLDNAVYDLIGQRRACGVNGTDLLGLLLSAKDEETGEVMSDQQIRDEIVTFFIGGSETTKLGLTWTWYLLSQNTEVEERLHEEIDRVLAGRTPTMKDLPQLTYTKMVINEALRLYPPVWVTMRRTMQEDEIGGYHLPQNTFVIFSPYFLHRHPDFWDEPERFLPERFHPDQKENYTSAAYIPFGSGLHMCIGKNFASMQMMLVLVMIAQRYRLTLKPGHVVKPNAGVILTPHNGLPMHLHRRFK